MPNSNLEQLIETAALLRPMLEDLVFVGGAITSLLVTDDGAGAPRTTLDVDAIAEITSNAAYSAYEVISAIASTSSVVRGAPAPSSVTSRLVMAPPTNTRSSSIGRSSAAVSISCSRLEFGISQPPV